MNQLSTIFLLCCGTLFGAYSYGQNTIAHTANQDLIIETLQDANQDYSNVYHLRLVNQGYTSIPKEIAKMTNLISLDLSGNELEDVGDVLQGLEQLEFLKLNENHLTTVPTKALKHCKRLKDLYLRNNRIKELDATINQFQYLEKLDLAHNGLSTVVEDIRLPELINFKAEGNALTAYPSFLNQSPKLKYLNLNTNQISGIEEVSTLPQLISLNIGKNPIKSIVPAMSLTNLEYLTIDWIDLSQTSITPSMVKLKWLRVLSAEHCQLTVIPTWFNNLKRLEELSLLHNNIKHIPAFMHQQKRLRKLWMGYSVVLYQELKELEKSLKRCEVFSGR